MEDQRLGVNIFRYSNAHPLHVREARRPNLHLLTRGTSFVVFCTSTLASTALSLHTLFSPLSAFLCSSLFFIIHRLSHSTLSISLGHVAFFPPRSSLGLSDTQFATILPTRYPSVSPVSGLFVAASPLLQHCNHRPPIAEPATPSALLRRNFRRLASLQFQPLRTSADSSIWLPDHCALRPTARPSRFALKSSSAANPSTNSRRRCSCCSHGEEKD